MSKSKVKLKATAKKKKVNVSFGVFHVHTSFNNTIISITNSSGDLLAWSSAGKMGFKGSKKATPYAVQVCSKDVLDAVKVYGLTTIAVEIRGPGIGRDASLRALQESNLNVTSITDKTYYPFNGCRPPKRRRN